MIRVDGARLQDAEGRTCILRGVNLGGSSKIPARPRPGTAAPEASRDHRDVSFVGRPFPLAEAEEHFRRLRDWGMLFNRFVVTWEAVEHRGPGEYDREYLDFLEAVLARGAALGLRFVVDFHQDVWSRFTGGDGAPGWTLELAGLNPRTLAAAGAAVLRGESGGRMPNLLWPTNNWKLGAATMATLFFGGDAFAPGLRVANDSIQSFLQGRYAGFAREVARKVAGIDSVEGFDLVNEPPAGFIGYSDLASDRSMFVRTGATPSPFDGMAAGSGFPREVPVYRQTLLGLRRIGQEVINPGGASAWLPGRGCPWQSHGVWADRGGKPLLLRPGYFAALGGRRVSFGADFLRPFLARVGREIRAIRPDKLLFIEDSPRRNELAWSAQDGPNAVFAAHWYDSLTMFRKHFTPWMCVDERTLRPAFGRFGVRRSFRRQIGAIPAEAARCLGGIPSFVGEFGLPFDLDGGAAFATGDYRRHARGLAAYYDALDANLLGCAIWNYTADNTVGDGDGWNGEDFSVFSRGHGDAGGDEAGDGGAADNRGAAADGAPGGGRAVDGFCRPYATRIPGTPLAMRYEASRRRFFLAFLHDPGARGNAEIFVPPHLARGGIEVRVSDGAWHHDPPARTLFYAPGPGLPRHEITVRFR